MIEDTVSPQLPLSSHFYHYPPTTTDQPGDRAASEPTGSDHKRRRSGDTPMCSCGAYRSAAQSPLGWPILTESNSDNHDQDISARDNEFEVRAHPSSIKPIVQVNPDECKFKHRACQHPDCHTTGVTSPTEMPDPTKCRKSSCEDPNLCQAESEVSARIFRWGVNTKENRGLGLKLNPAPYE